MAISMLSSDTLRRIDVTDKVLEIVDEEVKPMIKLLTGEEPGMLQMMGVKMKVRSMLNATVPGAKATLFAMGMAKLFVLEIGPLLTALLLTGRIGGSYAGKVSTMQATAQNKLLRTLGINPRAWSLYPSLAAALIAGPVLTILGTWLALFLGSYVGPFYGIGSHEGYWQEVRSATFPDLRLRGLLPLQKENSTATILDALFYSPDFRTPFSDDYMDTIIEISTYPVVYHLLKATTFMVITMSVAEVCSRIKPNLSPRGVPSVITSSVVIAGLLVILADWGFSRLWLKRV
jgi:ABC-type transporter Mla maintaining outer membrane lipid asymmetry permease subunit MlaE